MTVNPQDQSEVSALYKKFLDCWNKRNAAEFAALFAEDGNQVGFDGRPELAQELTEELRELLKQ